MTVDPMEIVREAAPVDGEPVLMMPAEAYTSPEVLAWERRHLFAGTWSCLGRVDDLFPADAERPVTQRALAVGDVACLLVREQETLRMYANTCRHRGHELLPEGDTSERRSVVCPYHAWTYDLQGQLIGARGFRDDETFEFTEHGLVELPVRVWEGWVFGHALHPAGSRGGAVVRGARGRAGRPGRAVLA